MTSTQVGGWIHVAEAAEEGLGHLVRPRLLSLPPGSLVEVFQRPPKVVARLRGGASCQLVDGRLPERLVPATGALGGDLGLRVAPGLEVGDE